jgi:Asp/Glu/hydantoin racemase
MRLLVFNPNTSESITQGVARALQGFAPEAAITPLTAAFGPRYIGTRAGCVVAAHAVLEAVATHVGPASAPRFDGVLLACFGDPGLEAAREISPIPVTGLAEASIVLAARRPGKFSILTGGPRWIPMLREFVAAHGLADRLASVRAVKPTGAEIAADPQGAIAVLARDAQAAIDQDGASSVILGGAGMAGIAPSLQTRVSGPVLDCIESGARYIAELVAQGRAGDPDRAFGPPPPVEAIGVSADLAARFQGR